MATSKNQKKSVQYSRYGKITAQQDTDLLEACPNHRFKKRGDSISSQTTIRQEWVVTTADHITWNRWIGQQQSNSVETFPRIKCHCVSSAHLVSNKTASYGCCHDCPSFCPWSFSLFSSCVFPFLFSSSSFCDPCHRKTHDKNWGTPKGYEVSSHVRLTSLILLCHPLHLLFGNRPILSQREGCNCCSNPEWIPVWNNVGFFLLQIPCKSGQMKKHVVTAFSWTSGPEILFAMDLMGNTPLHYRFGMFEICILKWCTDFLLYLVCLWHANSEIICEVA